MPSGFVIDALPMVNESRFINDAYGSDQEPNVESKWVEIQIKRGAFLQTAVICTTRDIAKEEEILLCYNWLEDKWKSLICEPKPKLLIDLTSDEVVIVKHEFPNRVRPTQNNPNIEKVQKIVNHLHSVNSEKVDAKLWNAFIASGEAIIAHALVNLVKWA